MPFSPANAINLPLFLHPRYALSIMTDKHSTKPSLDTLCHAKGCGKHGDYRAPISPDSPNEYIWFCLEHVREYNAKWDYLKGANRDEVEKQIRNATVWERPTWPFGKGPLNFNTSSRPQPYGPAPLPKAVQQSLAVFQLDPPVTLTGIKARYRALAKKYHPDANQGSKAKIEAFHKLQQAFGTLQKYYATKGKSKTNPHE